MLFLEVEKLLDWYLVWMTNQKFCIHSAMLSVLKKEIKAIVIVSLRFKFIERLSAENILICNCDVVMT